MSSTMRKWIVSAYAGVETKEAYKVCIDPAYSLLGMNRKGYILWAYSKGNWRHVQMIDEGSPSKEENSKPEQENEGQKDVG